MKSEAVSVSIVVPVLNEGRLLGGLLRRLRSLGPDLEIIVADGGSCDDTMSIARSCADRVLIAPPGRAAQMNAGAAVATGDILWFLHADLRPPSDAIGEIQYTLADHRVAGGCFRLRYPRPEWVYRTADSLGNLGVDIFGFALGDHGIFCRRSAFNRAGGYPIVPILEDAELYRRLRQRGRMKQLPEEILSDPRTFEKAGRYRTMAVYFLILALYVMGAPITCLNRLYRRFHRRFEIGALSGSGDGLSRDPAKRAGEFQLR
jgi:rSAM/selenodomain-associated transferase 2